MPPVTPIEGTGRKFATMRNPLIADLFHRIPIIEKQEQKPDVIQKPGMGSH
jgi:hypothetical protein